MTAIVEASDAAEEHELSSIVSSMRATHKPQVGSLIRRLQTVPDLSSKDLLSMIFVIRLVEGLHRNSYGTFLSLSLVARLCEYLKIPDLQLYMEDPARLRWSYCEGMIIVEH